MRALGPLDPAPASRSPADRIRARAAAFKARSLQTHLARAWATLTFVPTVAFFFLSAPPHAAYRLGWPERFRLAWRMWRNARAISTGTSYKAHLAMAAKLLEIPPDTEGSVVECGCYMGGSTANLSLACEIAGRDLIVYDSFEGLPAPTPGDKYAKEVGTGLLAADLETVKANVSAYGAIDRCTFRKGWFDETLPGHKEPIVLAFLDVDYQASLDACVRNLWPRLTDRGYVFIDEFVLTDYCALFWSERYWRTHFDATPPGLIGSGTGVGTGAFYLGPFNWGLDPTSVAYTRKDFSGHWDYFPDDGETG